MTAELIGFGALRAPRKKPCTPVDCNPINSFYGSAPMKVLRVPLRPVFLPAVLFVVSQTFAGAGGTSRATSMDDLEVPRFEWSAESAFLFSVLHNPLRYRMGAEFVTARMRWGIIESDNWLRGYNQFCVLAMAEPIFSGPENHYFGFSLGMRYNFVRPSSRLVPYISGSAGLGWIDSHANIRGAQGQDSTFNILTAVGISYKMNDRWKVNAGILYEHLSNGGQTSPNPSLNLVGPQLGLDYSF